MKTIFLTFAASVIFMISAEAQVSHDYYIGDREPIVTATIEKSEVPVAVVNAVTTQFDRNNPMTWSKFPYALKEYGWVYDIGAEDIVLDRYEVTMKTDKGNDLWAVYTNKGELVQTREMSKNIAIPKEVMEMFNNSQYKDWNIIGNREIIKYYHDHTIDRKKIEQHFRLTVEKDGAKRNISFNWKDSN
ncbi:MAG: hypothetical protein JXR66_06140 [Bacteroidales bacterium]|nr:hypothetical protein [Bacteroidales bacterium]MBN2633115.1 hypothetical protein [Bacteroidales bacterium]